MKPDFYTKAVLTVIAFALVVLALQPWLAPPVLRATGHLNERALLSDIARSVAEIAGGQCRNRKICGR